MNFHMDCSRSWHCLAMEERERVIINGNGKSSTSTTRNQTLRRTIPPQAGKSWSTWKPFLTALTLLPRIHRHPFEWARRGKEKPSNASQKGCENANSLQICRSVPRTCNSLRPWFLSDTMPDSRRPNPGKKERSRRRWEKSCSLAAQLVTVWPDFAFSWRPFWQHYYCTYYTL